ncbi:MAG: hypothetical protein SPI35_06410 [Porphyromonas sp.]|nr:hypothetical protein [Porphyromonas sp.]
MDRRARRYQWSVWWLGIVFLSASCSCKYSELREQSVQTNDRRETIRIAARQREEALEEEWLWMADTVFTPPAELPKAADSKVVPYVRHTSWRKQKREQKGANRQQTSQYARIDTLREHSEQCLKSSFSAPKKKVMGNFGDWGWFFLLLLWTAWLIVEKFCLRRHRGA